MRILVVMVTAAALAMGGTACAEEEAVPEQLPDVVVEEPVEEATPSQAFTCDRLKQRVHAICEPSHPHG